MKLLHKISQASSAVFRCALALWLVPLTAEAQVPVKKPAGNPSVSQRTSSPTTARSLVKNTRVGEAGGEQATPPSPIPPPSADTYVLVQGDTVKLLVYGEDELDAEATISKSGEVSFQLIGAVPLAGKTVRAAEKIVWDLYNRDYLVTPKVSLTLSGYASRMMNVSGAVLKPGPVSMPPGGRFDVLSALDAAGGCAENANLRAVTLRRASGGGPIPCDVAAMRVNPGVSLEIKPGDSLNVPLKVAKWVTVRGHVNRPSEVEVPESGRIDVLTAITKAGDFDKLASKKGILIRRVGRATPFSLNVGDMIKGKAELFYLIPGDIVTVPETSW